MDNVQKYYLASVESADFISPEVGGSESETERKPEVPASPRDEALFH